MKFEVGKLYKTRDGRKAQIFMLDNGAGHMYGAVSKDGSLWNAYGWYSDGESHYDELGCEHKKYDLVSEWPDLESDFTKVTVAGVDYYDAKKDFTHQEALDLAAKHGLRVMESWEMHRLWVESEEFRKSLQPKWYWCASVDSGSRGLAWRFYGYSGYVPSDPRNLSSAVRMIASDE